jgi:hypothetical protein
MTVIRITITETAYEANCSTLPKRAGSVAYPA